MNKLIGHQNVVFISTFVIFVMEAIATFVIGKNSGKETFRISQKMLPTAHELLKILIVVGFFSCLNQFVVSTFKKWT